VGRFHARRNPLRLYTKADFLKAFGVLAKLDESRNEVVSVDVVGDDLVTANVRAYRRLGELELDTTIVMTHRLSIHTSHNPRDESVRAFLFDQYSGRCQICHSTFAQKDGTPYFEAFHLAERQIGPHTDRPGGVLCLSNLLQEASVRYGAGRRSR
jgi:predicted restriction endonuclease